MQRHHIYFEHDRKGDYIILGASTNAYLKLLGSFFYIGLAIVVFFVALHLLPEIPSILAMIIPGVFLIYGLFQYRQYTKLRQNKDTKIISKDNIQIGATVYPKSEIEKLDYLVNIDDEGHATAILKILTSKAFVPLLTIIDKNPNLVRKDIQFIQQVLTDFMDEVSTEHPTSKSILKTV